MTTKKKIGIVVLCVVAVLVCAGFAWWYVRQHGTIPKLHAAFVSREYADECRRAGGVPKAYPQETVGWGHSRAHATCDSPTEKAANAGAPCCDDTMCGGGNGRCDGDESVGDVVTPCVMPGTGTGFSIDIGSHGRCSGSIRVLPDITFELAPYLALF